MKHTATPKTWDVRKQGGGHKQPKHMAQAARARLVDLLSDALGYSPSWFDGKPDGLLHGLARKHL